jgi:PIN domain nuclease of toxin-antitoxin system
LVIEPADAVAGCGLSSRHDDPFDRMLIVQARRIAARSVTCDDTIRRH